MGHSILKDELQRELKDALVTRRQSAGPADVTLNLAEGSGAVQGGNRITWIHVIRQIEGFAPKLKRLSLTD